MDKDRIEGKLDEIKGRIKRQVGEWTGEGDAQAEGTTEQAKGKIQNAWGKLKDAGRDTLDRADEKVDLDKDKEDAA